ncbi:MAG: tRNA lysidine(34) synthetase TilS [Sulfurimonas sp.]|nr:MAG: tRNA lysidine(34) synthetase TilS [Sulfurimonas sp.]
MLELKTLALLKNKKNLLAFSAGIDSTALFFLLINSKIKFDIAIVNYSVREQSKEEVLYAQELAKKYNIICHIHNAIKINKNFEAKARELRYNFFHTLIKENSYNNLLTAHHLGDRFEWMMMQFCKGAGCAELTGMSILESRDNYSLIRPLLHLDKTELLKYLDNEKIKYFIDKTNYDKSIKRNNFRHNITKPLLKEYLSGIKKSFEYIDEDKQYLIKNTDIVTIKDFSYFKSFNSRSDIYTIDKHLKSLGHIITAKERELLKKEKSLVLGRKFLIVQDKSYIFISPFTDEKTTINKEFKELCRALKIEPKFRTYLYNNTKIFEKVRDLITKPKIY